MLKLRDGEDLNAAIKRMNEASSLVDIDLSAFETKTNDESSSIEPNNNETSVVSDSTGEEE
jgi:hypothetical protein